MDLPKVIIVSYWVSIQVVIEICDYKIGVMKKMKDDSML